jgi:hypothetical protein
MPVGNGSGTARGRTGFTTGMPNGIDSRYAGSAGWGYAYLHGPTRYYFAGVGNGDHRGNAGRKNGRSYCTWRCDHIRSTNCNYWRIKLKKLNLGKASIYKQRFFRQRLELPAHF